MKKLLILIMTLASFGFVIPASETVAANAASVSPPQVIVQVGQKRRHRNRRWRRFENRGRRIGYRQAYTTTRFVRRGWATYRETYRVWVLPNGRTQSTLISRVRVR